MIIFLNGEITKATAKIFLDQMQDEELEIRIDSVGGDLFEGLKIYNALLNHTQRVNIIVDGVAGSIASVIALASENREIAETGSFMIHHALVPSVSGNHEELQKIVNTLEEYSKIIASVYARNTKLSIDEALDLMSKEKTFTAEDSVKLGFSKSIVEPLKAVAKINQIDMNLLQSIKAKLTGDLPVIPAVEAVDLPANPEAPEVQGLTPEDEEAVRIIVAEMIAEALAGNTEEVGATIATVLNSITSKGAVDQQAGGIVTPEATVSGIDAFNKKMDEIKNQN